MGSILSIDYGNKRIGIAVSDFERKFAFPCSVIENKNFNYVSSELSKIITQREIDLIIIGMPYNQWTVDSDQWSVKKESMENIVTEFTKKLQKHINIPIEVVDERLSSFAAEENLKEIGFSAKDSKKHVDQEAARLLLEEYIQKIQVKPLE